jgi:regulator of replication initiation timing
MAVPPASSESGYSLLEVATHLQLAPAALRSLSRRFAGFLSADVENDAPRYSSGDVATLLSIQQLLAQGRSDEEVAKRLMPRRIEAQNPPTTAVTLSPQQSRDLVANDAQGLPHAVADVLSTIANSQQTVLNSQSTMREMVSVVVQDNFNLKEENRKLRERMLELERALAEYQRREETRKERMEGRMRALEGTVAALQQQMAQFVQLQRGQPRRRGWFW